MWSTVGLAHERTLIDFMTVELQFSGGSLCPHPDVGRDGRTTPGVHGDVHLPARPVARSRSARLRAEGEGLVNHFGVRIAGCLRSKNSGSPTLSLFISSMVACNSGGTSLRSPSRASASVVKYMTMV